MRNNLVVFVGHKAFSRVVTKLESHWCSGRCFVTRDAERTLAVGPRSVVDSPGGAGFLRCLSLGRNAKADWTLQ